MYAFLILLLLLSVVPFYLVVVNATSRASISSPSSICCPARPRRELRHDAFPCEHLAGFANSLLIAVPTPPLTGYFGALTAYGFAKYSFKGKNVLFGIVLCSMMIPSQVRHHRLLPAQPEAAPAEHLLALHPAGHRQRHLRLLPAGHYLPRASPPP